MSDDLIHRVVRKVAELTAVFAHESVHLDVFQHLFALFVGKRAFAALRQRVFLGLTDGRIDDGSNSVEGGAISDVVELLQIRHIGVVEPLEIRLLEGIIQTGNDLSLFRLVLIGHFFFVASHHVLIKQIQPRLRKVAKITDELLIGAVSFAVIVESSDANLKQREKRTLLINES